MDELRLIPARFVCREHGEDLTEAVRDRVSYRRPVASLNFRRGRPPPPAPFVVQVTCPQGGGHELEFAGSVR